jgi:hypothetical protein
MPRTSGPVLTIAPVFRALLICGDGDCAETFEAFGSLDELEALACDCDCALEVLEMSELEEAAVHGRGFTLMPLP